MAAQKMHFLVIDDSKLNCFIAEKVIRNNNDSHVVQVFMEATEALESIKTKPDVTETSRSIIFLDIQMPVMNGFEFVEKFEKLPETIRTQYNIFMISSSVNENDHNRIRNYPSVMELLIKPLTKEMLNYVIDFKKN
ncbi:MAG TPA: response regulator [Sphingobacteriaceae bacterium]|nr:response regulator [Sphingobacteriaceae bacterium]